MVDEATGLPFYNECLMRCQLGPNAKARAHPGAAAGAASADGAVSTLSDKAGASGDAKPTDPVLALVPPPVETGSKKGASRPSSTIRCQPDGVLGRWWAGGLCAVRCPTPYGRKQH